MDEIVKLQLVKEIQEVHPHVNGKILDMLSQRHGMYVGERCGAISDGVKNQSFLNLITKNLLIRIFDRKAEGMTYAEAFKEVDEILEESMFAIANIDTRKTIVKYFRCKQKVERMEAASIKTLNRHYKKRRQGKGEADRNKVLNTIKEKLDEYDTEVEKLARYKEQLSPIFWDASSIYSVVEVCDKWATSRKIKGLDDLVNRFVTNNPKYEEWKAKKKNSRGGERR